MVKQISLAEEDGNDIFDLDLGLLIAYPCPLLCALFRVETPRAPAAGPCR